MTLRALLLTAFLSGPAFADRPGYICDGNSCRPAGTAYEQLRTYGGTLPGVTPPTGETPPVGETGEVTGDAPPSGGPAPTGGPYTLRRGGCSTCPGARRFSARLPPAPGGFSAEGGGVMAAAGGGGGGCGGKKSCAVRMGGFVQSCRSFLGRLFGGLFGRRGC